MKFKRLFAFILAFLLFIIPVSLPVSAATYDLGLDLYEKLMVYDLSLALQQGVELDWSDLDLNSLAISNEEKARRMLSYYGAKAGSLYKAGLIGMYDFLFTEQDFDHETAAIVFSTNANISMSSVDAVRSAIQASYVDGSSVTVPIDPLNSALWSKHDSLALNDYVSRMNISLPSSGDVGDVPNPPTDFKAVVDLIQSASVFNNKSLMGIRVSNNYTFMFGSAPSVYSSSGSFNDTGSYASSNAVYYLSSCVCHLVHNTTTGGYDFYVDSFSQVPSGSIVLTTSSGNYVSRISSSPQYEYVGANAGAASDQVLSSISGNSFDNLSQALTWISARFRNITLYVDGNLWASSGDSGHVIDKGIEVTVPDAVIDDVTGEIVAHNISVPLDQSGNVKPFNIDLDGVFDLITDHIANGIDTLDWTDIISEGVLTGVDGVVLTIDDFTDVPASKVIDTPVTATDVLTDSVPRLPSLPAYNNSGFAGVSVLARIINMTNQSLPSELVLCFYGVVFGICILGLIKILHK